MDWKLAWGMLALFAAAAAYVAVQHFAYRFADARGGVCLSAKKQRTFAGVLLAAVFVVLIPFFFLTVTHFDLRVYNGWGEWIVANGTDNFYKSNEIAMPPLFLYLCAGLSGFSSLTGIPYWIVYRCVFSICFVLSAWVFYRVALRRLQQVPALAATLLYAVCPALLINCGVWAQTDVFTCLFTLLLFHSLADRKYLLSFVWLWAGISLKFQIVFVLPVLIVWIICRMVKEKLVLRLLLYTAGLIVAAVLPYIPVELSQLRAGNVLFLFDVFAGIANNKSWFSSYALNLWSALGFNYVWAYAPFWRYFSYALVLAASAGLTVALFRSKYEHKLLVACILQIMIFFFLCIAMLERYLIATVPLLLLLCAQVKDRRLRACAYFMNTMQAVVMVMTWICTTVEAWYGYLQGMFFLFAIVHVAAGAVFAERCLRLLFPSFRFCALFAKVFRKKEKAPREEEEKAEESAAAQSDAPQG